MKNIIVFIFLFTIQPINAQSLISPFGGFVANNDCSISFTGGEMITETIKNTDCALTQGFQQPNLKIPEIIDLDITNGLIQGDNNGNGIFIIEGLEIYPNNKLVVLNRWGAIVYEAQPYQNDWDGNYEGAPLPQATYYYILTPDISSKTVLKGNLYLLKQ